MVASALPAPHDAKRFGRAHTVDRAYSRSRGTGGGVPT